MTQGALAMMSGNLRQYAAGMRLNQAKLGQKTATMRRSAAESGKECACRRIQWKGQGDLTVYVKPCADFFL